MHSHSLLYVHVTDDKSHLMQKYQPKHLNKYIYIHTHTMAKIIGPPWWSKSDAANNSIELNIKYLNRTAYVTMILLCGEIIMCLLVTSWLLHMLNVWSCSLAFRSIVVCQLCSYNWISLVLILYYIMLFHNRLNMSGGAVMNAIR